MTRNRSLMRGLIVAGTATLALTMTAPAQAAIYDSAATAGATPKCQVSGTATACISLVLQAVGATQGTAAPANTEFTCTATVAGVATNVVLTRCSVGTAFAAPYATAALTSTALGITLQNITNGIKVCAAATAVIPAAPDFSTGTICAQVGGTSSATHTYTALLGA